MARKKPVSFAAMALAIAIMLSACTGAPSGTSGTSSTATPASTPANSGTTSSPAQVEDLKFEDIKFPESMPSKIVMAEEGLYGYDDMTERYGIEILMTNYGEETPPPDQDPINQWMSKRFNMDIKVTAVNGADFETNVSTRFAANDVPDLLMLPSSTPRDYGFSLSDQGLLVDARNIYPYMKHSNNYTTQGMIQWSTNTSNNEIPFVTKYSIQDGVWGLAIRSDWMKNLGITEYPTTKQALMDYAKAVTFNDPDGNGKNDTYFMTANGNGTGWGMLTAFETMFGNPAAHVEDGQLSYPYFNGVRKDYLTFLKELYDEKLLAPDWFTTEWEAGTAIVFNDKIGMVRWPVGALYQQYALEAKQKDLAALDVWDYWVDPPIEGGKYEANGNPGFLWAFPKAKYTEGDALNMGKIKRVAHMLDSMTIGNENYFPTIQGSSDEVFKEAGITLEGSRVGAYTENGTFFISNPGKAPYTKESGRTRIEPWQQFGLCVTYQVDYTDPSDPFLAKYAERTALQYQTVNLDYDRWPNDALLVTYTGKAAETLTTVKDWVMSQEYAFVTGGRSMDEYDAFCTEWLNKGGKEVITQAATQLGVPVPDYAK